VNQGSKDRLYKLKRPHDIISGKLIKVLDQGNVMIIFTEFACG
jgi:hypothetical protein